MTGLEIWIPLLTHAILNRMLKKPLRYRALGEQCDYGGGSANWGRTQCAGARISTYSDLTNGELLILREINGGRALELFYGVRFDWRSWEAAVAQEYPYLVHGARRELCLSSGCLSDTINSAW